MNFVLLHPLGADAGFWSPVRTELDSTGAVAIDLPGHGIAPVAHDTGIAAYSQSIVEFLESTGAAATVVGMSLGGLVAQYIGATRPDLVASVVLVDTVPVSPDTMRAMWRDRAAAARTSGLSTLVEPMVDMWFTSSYARSGPEPVHAARRTFAATDPEGYARAADLLAEVDLRRHFADWSVPAVVVCGEDDAPPFRDGAQWLAEHTGAQNVYWVPGKHACAVETAEKFAALLLATAPS
jgi:3-oxoadipate enol-lactonase